jgi:hypothetical protein
MQASSICKQGVMIFKGVTSMCWIYPASWKKKVAYEASELQKECQIDHPGTRTQNLSLFGHYPLRESRRGTRYHCAKQPTV